MGLQIFSKLGSKLNILSGTASDNDGKKQSALAVAKVINASIDQRFFYEVVPDIEDGHLVKTFSGACIACDQESFLVDIGSSYPVYTLEGRSVTVTFRKIRSKAWPRFCCTTRVLRVVETPSGYGLELLLPEKLQDSQRRAFVRFNLPKAYIADMGIWDAADIEQSSTDTLPPPNPNLSLLQIKDISAGGAGLIMPYGNMVPEGLLGQDALLMLLTLHNNERKPTLGIWLNATPLKGYQIVDRAVLAVRFIKWSLANEQGQALNWLPVAKDAGVPPLGGWIMRKQLEMHKANMVRNR